MTAPAVVRSMAVTWWLHLKMMHRSVFHGLLQVVWPLFFATAALLMYGATAEPRLVTYAALGAAVMSTWTAISSTGSATLHRERGLGTLELLVAAPTPFGATIFSIILAVATVGAYGVAATLLWARLVFAVEVPLGDPLWFSLSLMATVFSFAVLGFLLAVTVIRYPDAWALGGLLEYPVWLLGGFLVPAEVLPGWMRPAAMALSPYWGMSAVRKAADGSAPWRDVLVCLGLSGLYALLGVGLVRLLLNSARRTAMLSAV